MPELLQEDYLAVGALGVRGVLKSIKVFLEGVGSLRLPLNHLPNYPISSVS